MNQVFQIVCVSLTFKIFVFSIPEFNFISNFDEEIQGLGGYKWQECGIGYNLNTMINSWLYYISVENDNEFSLVMDYEQGMLSSLECSNANGWNCIFGDIHHLHVIESVEKFEQKLILSNVSSENIEKSIEEINKEGWGAPNSIFSRRTIINNNLNTKFGIDHLSGLSIIFKHIWKNMSQWIRNDIDSFNHSNVFKEYPYIGLHIRRGDKIYFKEANITNTEVYLQEALYYLESTNRVSEMKGIWVASDDTEVIHEVRNLSSTYFPNILHEDIVYHSDKGIDQTKKEKRVPWDTPISTRSKKQTYESFMYLFLDIEMLSKAEVFIGTFSSNLGRLIVTSRESFTQIRDSSISVDWKNWFPGRK